MTARFTVLASGSGGNATLLEVNGFGLLIDCGLPAKDLTARLSVAGASWDRESTSRNSDVFACPRDNTPAEEYCGKSRHRLPWSKLL